MTERNKPTAQQKEALDKAADKVAVRAWLKKTLDQVVTEMLRKGVVTGVAIEASPAWQVPFQILIAKVWDAQKKSNFTWVIAGENAKTDHIAGSLAANPQEVARHFSLKWQMDADRLSAAAIDKAGSGDREVHMDAYAKDLIRYAETLYDLASRDEIWKARLH